MIVDKLSNAEIYYGLGENVKKAFEYLKTVDFSGIELGKYSIDGDNVLALFQQYAPKTFEDARIEAHKKYIDIQYIVEGEEYMGYSHLDRLTSKVEYNVEKDIEFFSGEVDLIKVTSGMFALFLPEDGHKPCITTNECNEIKKIVMKIKVD